MNIYLKKCFFLVLRQFEQKKICLYTRHFCRTLNFAIFKFFNTPLKSKVGGKKFFFHTLINLKNYNFSIYPVIYRWNEEDKIYHYNLSIKFEIVINMFLTICAIVCKSNY